MKWQLLLPGLCCGMPWTASGCDFAANSVQKDRVTDPTDVSVTPDMLIGARYRGRTGGKAYDDLAWTFDETHIRIVAGEQGLPNDQVDALLPADTSGFRMDGRWGRRGRSADDNRSCRRWSTC